MNNNLISRKASVILLIFGVFFLSTFLFSTTANAAVKIKSKTTNARVELNHSFLVSLNKRNIIINNGRPAVGGFESVTFPIYGGVVRPGSGVGIYKTKGSVRFKRGSRSVGINFKSFVVKNNSSYVLGSVSGVRMKVLTLGRGKLTRAGFDTELKKVNVRLTPRAASRINLILKLNKKKRFFKRGQLLGVVRLKAIVTALEVNKNSKLNLTQDNNSTSPLKNLNIKINAYSPAKYHGLEKGITLPVMAGQKVNRSNLAASLKTRGGIIFRSPKKSVRIGGLTYVNGKSPYIRGHASNGKNLKLFHIKTNEGKVDPITRKITYNNIRLFLSNDLSSLLNTVFETTSFNKGNIIARAKLSLYIN